MRSSMGGFRSLDSNFLLLQAQHKLLVGTAIKKAIKNRQLPTFHNEKRDPSGQESGVAYAHTGVQVAKPLKLTGLCD
jgi:hypothetical protein